MKETQTHWEGLRTASGTAEEIPAALTALRSFDKKVRQAAYWKIDNHAVLQGDLYEAAPFVVRAVLDSLKVTSVANEEFYDLLIEFANGYAPETRVASVDGSEEPLLAATVRELAKGMALYWRDLRGPRSGIRKQVADLLLALSERVELDAGKLRSALDTEADEEVAGVLAELLRDVDP